MRDYLGTKPHDVQQELVGILKCHWGNYCVDSYDSNKNLNVLHGEQVRAFILDLTPKIVLFLRTRFVESHLLQDHTNVLLVWKEITKFIGITTTMKINDDDQQVLYEKRTSTSINKL